MSAKTCLTCLLVIALASACKTKLYIPTESNLTSETSLSELIKGRAIYVDKCSHCHDLHLPEEHTNNEWQEMVNKMQLRAKIDDGEKELILQYLWHAPQEKKKNSKKKSFSHE